MGTAGISASAAGNGVAAEQAMGCACSTVWDTLVLAAMTGVTFVAAALHGGYGFGNALALADHAFALVPVIGRYVLPVSITILGFSTIVGWYYIAEQAYRFLFRGRGIRVFSLVWIAATFLGGVASMELAWTLSDILCVFMMAPNLVSIIRLLPSASNDAFKLKLLASPRKNTGEKILLSGFNVYRKFTLNRAGCNIMNRVSYKEWRHTSYGQKSIDYRRRR